MAGWPHKSRGRSSGRRFPEEIKERVIRLYRDQYRDFGPTLAGEKLLERDGIKLSDETLRKWLMESGDWRKARKRKTHRKWRERKACFGEMLQMDGSHHDWLEGRAPEMVLMSYIDDATSTVYGRFYEYEGTISRRWTVSSGMQGAAGFRRACILTGTPRTRALQSQR